MTPLLSIVIANYNYGRFLTDAFESLLSQSCQDFEIIVIDGGSTDNSVEVIKKYAGGLPPGVERSEFESLKFESLMFETSNFKLPSPQTFTPSHPQTVKLSHSHTFKPSNISYWVSEPDHGQSHAFNKGFAHAHGRFLTWLNADDVLTPGALAAVVREIKRYPKCEWFIGSSVWTNPELRIHRCFCAHRFSHLRARYCTISAAGPSSFFTRRLYEAVGKIDENLHYVMDTDLWHKFYAMEGAVYRRTRHTVWAYRQHEASKMSGADEHTTTRALENRRRAVAESKTLVQRYGARSGWRSRLASWLSLSPLDHLVAHFRNLKWKGEYAKEI